MQKNKGLIVMAAVTLIAVAAALLDFKKEMDVEARKETESLLFNMKVDQVSWIELTTKEPSSVLVQGKPVVTNEFSLKKTDEGWEFESPFQERADSDGVSQFLDSLIEEKGIEVHGLGDNPSWAKFGLEKPKGAIAFQDQLGKKVRVEVSSKKNFEGAVYLRKDLESRVLLGSPGWSNKVEKKIFDFRDKRILRSSPQQIEKISLSRGTDLFEFSVSEAKWKLDSRPTWKLDQNRVQQLINSLTGNVITEYLKEGSVLPDDRKKWGVAQAEVVLKVLLRSNKNWNARIGAIKNGGYPVEILEPASIVQIAAVDGEKLVKLKAEQLRDRTTPFEFNKDAVEKIELRSAEKSLELQKKNNEWQVSHSEGGSFDPKLVPGLIEKIRALEAAEYLEGTAALPAKLVKSLQLRDGQGKLIVQLGFGSAKKKKVEGMERVVLMAQSSLVGELLTVDESKIKDLGIEQIFGVKK